MDSFSTPLYVEILSAILAKEEIQISFPNLGLNAAELVEGQCYKALQKIKAVIEDDSLEDSECFLKIEEIICILEESGTDGGFRHDF